MARKNHRPAIVEIINRAALPVGNSDIAEALDVHPQVITHCLRHLTEQEKIRRIGNGRFTRYIAIGPKGDAAWAAHIEPKVVARLEKANRELSLANLCDSIKAPKPVTFAAVNNLRKRGELVRRGAKPRFRYVALTVDQAQRRPRKKRTTPKEKIVYRRCRLATGEPGWEWLLMQGKTVLAQCMHLHKEGPNGARETAEKYCRHRAETLRPIRQGQTAGINGGI